MFPRTLKSSTRNYFLRRFKNESNSIVCDLQEQFKQKSTFRSNCRRDIGGRLCACPDPVSDSRPDRQLLAEAPVIPALRVPAREPARRPGEPAATDSHPRCSVPAAARIPRDTDAASPASTNEHAGHHSRAHVRHQ